MNITDKKLQSLGCTFDTRQPTLATLGNSGNIGKYWLKKSGSRMKLKGHGNQKEILIDIKPNRFLDYMHGLIISILVEQAQDLGHVGRSVSNLDE